MNKINVVEQFTTLSMNNYELASDSGYIALPDDLSESERAALEVEDALRQSEFNAQLAEQIASINAQHSKDMIDVTKSMEIEFASQEKRNYETKKSHKTKSEETKKSQETKSEETKKSQETKNEETSKSQETTNKSIQAQKAVQPAIPPIVPPIEQSQTTKYMIISGVIAFICILLIGVFIMVIMKKKPIDKSKGTETQ